jgi:hypothetical protein
MLRYEWLTGEVNTFDFYIDESGTPVPIYKNNHWEQLNESEYRLI